MEKLLADCLETLRRSPLNQRDKLPRGPSFVCPGTGSLRPRSPLRPPRARPRSEGRTGRLRARHLAARGAPGGQRIQLPARSLHFQGRGSNNKPSGAAAWAPLPRGGPRLPSAPRTGGDGAGPCHAPALRPRPSPGTARGARGSPHAHRPARLPLAHAGTPAPPPAPR